MVLGIWIGSEPFGFPCVIQLTSKPCMCSIFSSESHRSLLRRCGGFYLLRRNGGTDEQRRCVAIEYSDRIESPEQKMPTWRKTYRNRIAALLTI